MDITREDLLIFRSWPALRKVALRQQLERAESSEAIRKVDGANTECGQQYQ